MKRMAWTAHGGCSDLTHTASALHSVSADDLHCTHQEALDTHTHMLGAGVQEFTLFTDDSNWGNG